MTGTITSLSPAACLARRAAACIPSKAKRPAVVAEEVLPRPVGDHETGDAGPRRAAPRDEAEIEGAPPNLLHLAYP
ncbi:MAG TPA: hypothetical protein VFC19_14235 [Candidatus Limnocylindrales bacterium]|nr:hypothetical protein [Candidatus Limnocylindrales bacterium]